MKSRKLLITLCSVTIVGLLGATAVFAANDPKQPVAALVGRELGFLDFPCVHFHLRDRVVNRPPLESPRAIMVQARIPDMAPCKPAVHEC